MIKALLSLILLGSLPGAHLQDDAEPESGYRTITRTVDQAAAGRCLNGMVGFSLTMQCLVGTDGRPEACAVVNPTAASRRHDRVFQCMASNMRFHYEDGSAAVGENVSFRLGGRTWQTDIEYDRARKGQPQRP